MSVDSVGGPPHPDEVGGPRAVDERDSAFKRYRPLLGPIAMIVLFLVGMWWAPFGSPTLPPDPSGAPGGTVSWDDRDWDVFASTLEGADRAGWADLPMGDLMAEIGQSLVGSAYVPGTLEVEGPERLVINFRGLDCVTFVENVWAMAVAVKGGVADRLDDRANLEGQYERIVQALRYRDNVIDGYPSRLHYFTDWIADAERKRLLTDVSADLGGVLDREPIDFMSTHVEAYRQLSNLNNVDAIREVEARLSALGRHFIPEDRIEQVASRIQNGDIIAATSTVEGLDVAHTGLALWVDDQLRLLHAPLVGEAVQVSERSLAERIQAIDGQDGIIVARPSEPPPVRGR